MFRGLYDILILNQDICNNSDNITHFILEENMELTVRFFSRLAAITDLISDKMRCLLRLNYK